MNTLKLISVNIEGDKHLDLIQKFLQKEDAEVVCLQEVFEKDIEKLKDIQYPHHTFAPMMKLPRNNEYLLKGVALLSKIAIDSSFYEYYTGKKSLPVSSGIPNSNNRVLLAATITKENQQFTIATTHFTWSSKGKTTKKQEADLESLLKVLKKIDECILCGDFNAPRGEKIYKRLAELYTDNIPQDITSTMDPNLHKVKGLVTVVDYMFSTPQYLVKNIKIVDGVSDHKGIVADIEKIL